MNMLIYNKVYALEELADVDRDVSEALAKIPENAEEDSTVEITITWTQE